MAANVIHLPERNIVVVDAAGFQDTDTANILILNCFAMKMIFNHAASIRIVTTLKYCKFLGRDVTTRDNFEQLMQMCTDGTPDGLRRCESVLPVITCAPLNIEADLKYMRDLTMDISDALVDDLERELKLKHQNHPEESKLYIN